MKYLLIVILLASLLSSCSQHTSGTETEVNTGSIFGKLLTDDENTGEPVTVTLYCDSLFNPKSDTFDSTRSMTPIIDMFRFDSLPDGIYHIDVMQDDLIVGNEGEIEIDNGDTVEVGIQLSIIINQTFYIFTDQSTNITIENFTIINGKIITGDSGYVISYAQTDTLDVEIDVKEKKTTGTVKLRIILDDDNSARIEIIDSDIDDIAVYQKDGYLGAVIITIGKPGTINLETTFKTEEMPKNE